MARVGGKTTASSLLGGRFSLSRQASRSALGSEGGGSLALSYRQVESARIDWGLSAGLVDSDAFGDIGFLGVEIGLSN